MNFIITSLQSWDIEIGSTIKNTASEISKQHCVLYVNPPIDIITRTRIVIGKSPVSPITLRQLEVIQGKQSPLRKINEKLWVLDCPFTIYSVGKLPIWLFNFLNRRNGKKMGNWITEYTNKLDLKGYIHLIDTDLYRSLHLKEYIHPKLSIYYRRDYVIGFPYWRKHGPRCERKLAMQSDIVLANSSYFAEQLRPFNKNTHVLNTGVNLDIYNTTLHYNLPTDLENVPSPIIGYTGAIIKSRLDSNLLYNIATLIPEFSFVLVGPEDDYFKNHPLHQLKNVYFTGSKEVMELPQYIQYFDVCINPQILNPITDGNYPLKIDEYLAMGKPIVATNTHTMRTVFGDYTHLALSTEEWISSLKVAMKEVNDLKIKDKRISFAQTHSWTESVKTIYSTIAEIE